MVFNGDVVGKRIAVAQQIAVFGQKFGVNADMDVHVCGFWGCMPLSYQASSAANNHNKPKLKTAASKSSSIMPSPP